MSINSHAKLHPTGTPHSDAKVPSGAIDACNSTFPGSAKLDKPLHIPLHKFPDGEMEYVQIGHFCLIGNLDCALPTNSHMLCQ